MNKRKKLVKTLHNSPTRIKKQIMKSGTLGNELKGGALVLVLP